MKARSRILLFLLFAVLPLTLFSQGRTVVAAYMKIDQHTGGDYLEVEQAWKKIHQKAIEAGVYNGWQLWRNVHAGIDDPYQYITLGWYDDYAHSFGEDAPEDWMEGLFTDEEAEALYQKTMASRRYAFEEVSNLVTMVENPQPVKYLVVSRVNAKPGMADAYEKMEDEIFRIYHEELIRRGVLAHWGVWSIWPFKEGQPKYVIVNGYSNAKDLATPKPWIEPSELGMDYTMDEIIELVRKTREDITSTEVWELVDSVFPEE